MPQIKLEILKKNIRGSGGMDDLFIEKYRCAINIL